MAFRACGTVRSLEHGIRRTVASGYIYYEYSSIIFSATGLLPLWLPDRCLVEISHPRAGTMDASRFHCGVSSGGRVAGYSFLTDFSCIHVSDQTHLACYI